ncbi:MAG: hypothetical protein IJ192_10665 [Clostridia bacterium]|nr:hypothetical protein [Clostridia bacterium]
MITKAQAKATAKYQKNNYDDIRLRVKKGQREIIKVHAESLGKSLNAYINDLIFADMAAHGQKLDELPPTE